MDYFKEVSHGQLQPVPAMWGEFFDDTGGDGVLDGVVGPYQFPALGLSPEATRRTAIELAVWKPQPRGLLGGL